MVEICENDTSVYMLTSVCQPILKLATMSTIGFDDQDNNLTYHTNNLTDHNISNLTDCYVNIMEEKFKQSTISLIYTSKLILKKHAIHFFIKYFCSICCLLRGVLHYYRQLMTKCSIFFFIEFQVSNIRLY
jgi:hypothetical protein